jgi:tetratricopeptide (TPR) repeat protein
VALVGAMLCKPSAVTVPIIAATIDRLILQRRWRQIAVALIPWLAVSVAFTAISIFVQPNVAGSPSPLWTRPLIAADALAFYIGKLFAPVRLAAVYPHSEQQVLASPLVYVTWIAPAAIAFIAWRFRQAAPWAAAGTLIFLAALLPVLGLAPFEYESISTVADRYVYVAMLGPSLALAGLLSWLHFRASRQTVRYLAAGCVCGIATLAVLSARQARYWQDSRTLFTRVLALDPRNDVAYCNLATDALANGRAEEARRYASRAAKLFPGRPNNGITLGIALQSLGRHAEAAAEFLKVSQAHPDNVIALTYLASELARSGHEAQAMAVCRAALQIGPDFPDAHRLMATLLSAQNKFAEALPEAAEAVRLDPLIAANRLTYGKLLAATGHPNEADQQFAAARAIDPEGRDAASDPEEP